MTRNPMSDAPTVPMKELPMPKYEFQNPPFGSVSSAPLGGMGGGEDSGSSSPKSEDTHRAPEGPVLGTGLPSDHDSVWPPESADLGDGTCVRGRVTWLSSGEDEGPDVGLIVGLGGGCSLYVGEFADATIRDAGVEPDDFPGIGWWVAIQDGDGFQMVGPVADQHAGRALHDAVAGSLAPVSPASQPGTSACASEPKDSPMISATQQATGEGEKANHDCLAKRRPGEPMFILLGRDPDAHNIVRSWAERRLAAGGDPEHCRMGLDTAERMKAYASDPANAPASAPPAAAYPSTQQAVSPAEGVEPVAWRKALSNIDGHFTYSNVGGDEGDDWQPLYAAPVSLPAREEVARVIEPNAWLFYDRHEPNPRMAAEIKHEVRPSLTKADAILSLIKGDGRE